MARRLIDRTMFGEGDVTPELDVGVIAELEHSRRLAAYREYWAFFKGKHWSYARDENEGQVTVNFCRRFVQILSGWLFKRGFDVSIPDDPATEGKPDAADRDFISKALNETWRRNDMRPWGLECGQMGSVTGDVFLRPSWEVDDPLEHPFVRIDLIPPKFVFPEFGGPNGKDRKRMVQCTILFPQYVYEESDFGKKRKGLVTNGEIWTKDTWKIIQNGEVVETKENPFGEIPIVHIPNLQVAGEFYGVSDIADVVNIQKLYNEKITDVSDVIEYHGSPVTIVKGQSIKQLERGANQMWGIKKNAEIFNLELHGDLAASGNFIDRLEMLMTLMSGVPKEAMGEFNNSANTSAVAMALRFMPLTDIRDMKIATYGRGIRHVNRLIMKILRIKDDDFAEAWNKLQKENKKANLYRNDVTFNEPMPRDELIELQKSKERLLLRLSSRRVELERQGKTEDEINRIIEESDEDQANSSMAEVSGGMFPGNPTPPSGAARDAKISQSKEAKLPNDIE